MSNRHFFLYFLTNSILNTVSLMTHRTNLKGLRANACLILLSSEIEVLDRHCRMQESPKHHFSFTDGVFIGCTLLAWM